MSENFSTKHCQSMKMTRLLTKTSRIPRPCTEAKIEVRQVFGAEDFGAEFTPQLREQEDRLREQVKKR